MILHVGIPIAVQETMVQISFLVINSIVNNMGLMPSAGYGVAQKIVSFIMLIPSSVMQSLSAFVAQNIGAGKKSLAYNLVLRDPVRTLTDEEADDAIRRVLSGLAEIGVVIRS